MHKERRKKMEGRKEGMERERERAFENCFIDSPFYKTLAFLFFLVP
jgi:hypothetical protein